MRKGSKTMPKGSKLPVVYDCVRARLPGQPEKMSQPEPLQVYDVTFLHFHDLVELALCVEGEGICHVDGRDYPFRAGDVQIIFPYQQHLSKSVGEKPSRWYWLNVDPQDLLSAVGFADMTMIDEILQKEMGLCGIIDRNAYPQICDLIRKMIQEACFSETDPGHSVAYYGACFYMLLMELQRASGELRKISVGQRAELREIAPALMEIKNAVNSGRTLEVLQLPAICNMSTSSFRRKFKSTVGMSARDYITACRIHRACRIIRRGGEKIIDVSEQCGFATISGFNRSFLKYTGMSPSEFRKQL